MTATTEGMEEDLQTLRQKVRDKLPFYPDRKASEEAVAALMAVADRQELEDLVAETAYAAMDALERWRAVVDYDPPYSESEANEMMAAHSAKEKAEEAHEQAKSKLARFDAGVDELEERGWVDLNHLWARDVITKEAV